jgi:hypothetical protein
MAVDMFINIGDLKREAQDKNPRMKSMSLVGVGSIK